MAAPAQPTYQREKVAFEFNVPQMITLKYAQGKIVSGRFGDQVMYTTADNRVMFLDLAVAQQINLLEANAGETIGICKRKQGQQTRWDVWLSPETEKMRAARANPELAEQLRKSITAANEARYGGSPHGTLAVPSAPQSTGTGAVTPAPAQATFAGHSNTPNRTLIEETNGLVDAFASVLQRTLEVYQGRIKPDEVRALLLSAYIQRGKAGIHA